MAKSSSSLIFYYHLVSQPSRALKLLLDVNNISYTKKHVNLLQGEHLQEDYAKINPFQKVPVIKHNDFILTESIAIARYLCRELKVPDHWYPKESIKQAKVDEFLEWQHLELRYPCALFFQYKFLRPMLSGKPSNQERVNFMFKLTETACDKMENIWLKDHPFVCGEDVTIADLFGACELEQTKMAGYDPRNGRPKLSAWLSRLEQRLNPHYTNVHRQVNEITITHKGVPPSSVSKL